MIDTEQRFQIVRQYFDQEHRDHLKIIRTGLSIEAAQAHCRRDDTREVNEAGLVVWFDGYEPETRLLTYRAVIFDIPTLFRFNGGCYIDIMPLGEAVEVINIQGRSLRGDDDMRRECEAFIDDIDRLDWRHGYCAALVACDCGRCRRDR